VSGGITYSYVVTAKDVTGGCESASSNCSQAQTTGTCVEPPAFAGLQSVTNATLSTCTLDLARGAGDRLLRRACNLQRLPVDHPGLHPGPGQPDREQPHGHHLHRRADLSFGTIYYYVVRATDGASGVQEDNLVERSGSPTGPITIGTWSDNAGDTGTAQLTPTTPWSVATSGGHNGPKVYATGTYTDNLCSPLTSNNMHLGTGPALTFWSSTASRPGGTRRGPDLDQRRHDLDSGPGQLPRQLLVHERRLRPAHRHLLHGHQQQLRPSTQPRSPPGPTRTS